MLFLTSTLSTFVGGILYTTWRSPPSLIFTYLSCIWTQEFLFPSPLWFTTPHLLFPQIIPYLANEIFFNLVLVISFYSFLVFDQTVILWLHVPTSNNLKSLFGIWSDGTQGFMNLCKWSATVLCSADSSSCIPHFNPPLLQGTFTLFNRKYRWITQC